MKSVYQAGTVDGGLLGTPWGPLRPMRSTSAIGCRFALQFPPTATSTEPRSWASLASRHFTLIFSLGIAGAGNNFENVAVGSHWIRKRSRVVNTRSPSVADGCLS